MESILSSMKISETRLAKSLFVLFRPNYFATMGAFVGLFALVLPWLVQGSAIQGTYVSPPMTGDPDMNRLLEPRHILWNQQTLSFFGAMNWWEGDIGVFLVVYLAGTIIALFTPLGGLVQGIGLTGFVWNMRLIQHSLNNINIYRNEYEFGLGYFIALISMLIVTYAGFQHFWSRGDARFVPSQGRIAALSPRSVGLLR